MSDAVQSDSRPDLTWAQRKSIAAHRRAIESALRAAEVHETAAELQDEHVIHLRAGGKPEDMVARARKHAALERERAVAAREMAARHREALRTTYGLDE